MGIKKKSGFLLSEEALRKRYPDSNLASVIYVDVDEEDELRLPSRNLAINYHMGGGLPYGKIVEIHGEESTGKTLLAIDFGVVCQSLGGIVLWDDAEASFDARWAKKHGLDLNKLELLPYENEFEIVSDWVADMCVYYRRKLKKNEPILLVIDSIAVMETHDAMEIAAVDTKAEMGRRSYKMGEFLRKRTKIFAKYGICVLFINQMRKKVGASKFEDPDTTPLAQAIKYYAAQRIGLYRGKRLRKGGKDKGTWVGNLVYLRTKKNKTSAPKDNIQAEVYFVEDRGNFGYHKYFGFEELLVNKGIIKRKAGRYYYKGEEIARKNQTSPVEQVLREKIATDNTLRAKFIKKLGINTPSKTRERIKSITKNLYPVHVKKVKEEEGSEDQK